MSGTVVNIAGYRFADMPDRDELRQPFRDLCQELDLKGTILLAHEGINFFLAGSQTSIDSFVKWLEEDARFIDIPLKSIVFRLPAISPHECPPKEGDNLPRP